MATPSPPRLGASSTFDHTMPTLTPPSAPNFSPRSRFLKASPELTSYPSSASMPPRSASKAWGSTLTRLSPTQFARGAPCRSTRPTSLTVLSRSPVGGVQTPSSSTCRARWRHLQKASPRKCPKAPGFTIKPPPHRTVIIITVPHISSHLFGVEVRYVLLLTSSNPVVADGTTLLPRSSWVVEVS